MEQLANRVVAVILVCFCLVFFVVVGIGLFLQRNWFPLVGGFVMFDVFFFLVAFPLVGTGAAIWFLMRGRYIAVDQFGGYLRVFGKTTALPPLAPVAGKVAGSTSIAEVKPNIPRLSQLVIENSLVKPGEEGLEMFRYFGADEAPRYGSWPGVIGVAGMQNVGKSITMVTLAVIALYAGAKVVVCDLHHHKGRSLYRKLEALTGWVTFARSKEEVLEQVQGFSSELSARKGGAEPQPYVLLIDETAATIRALGEEVITAIDEASQEGHGFHMHMVLAIHDFSQDGLGDARIRDFLNFIYCHRMQSGQSKFVEAFKGKYGKDKTQAIIAALPPGHAMTRDELSAIEYGIMPMADGKDVLTAKNELLRFTAPMQRKQLASSEVHISHETEKLSLPEASEDEVQKKMNPLPEQIAYGSNFSMTPELQKAYSEEDESRMFDAYLALSKVKGSSNVRRQDLLEQCGWTNYKWQTVKAFCDERGIGK